jgi:hypothetical protein
MSTVVEKTVHPATAMTDEVDEAGLVDVVGLRIPRRRVLATVQINIDARELPRRRPHVSFEPEADEGAM